jgi:hypothetical protein
MPLCPGKILHEAMIIIIKVVRKRKEIGLCFREAHLIKNLRMIAFGDLQV